MSLVPAGKVQGSSLLLRLAPNPISKYMQSPECPLGLWHTRAHALLKRDHSHNDNGEIQDLALHVHCRHAMVCSIWSPRGAAGVAMHLGICLSWSPCFQAIEETPGAQVLEELSSKDVTSII